MGGIHGRDVRRADLTGRVFPGFGDLPHEGVLVFHGAGGGGGYEQEYARLLAHRVFPTAGHAIRVPYTGADSETAHRLGGTAAANARASAAAWQATLDTLATGLRNRE